MLRQKIKYLLFIGAVLTILAGPATAEVINKVAAVVNDTIITTYLLNQKVAEAATQNAKYSELTAEEQQTFKLEILGLMVEEELIQQRAKKLKVRASDEDVNAAIDDVQEQNKLTRLQLIAALEQQGMSFELYRTNMSNQITRYRLIGMEVQNKIDVNSQEIRRYYEQHLDEYSDLPYVHLSRLMFALSESTSVGEIAALQSQAEKTRVRLLQGDSIADLLITYSAASGGDMGRIKESDLANAFTDTIKNLQTGEISEIVKTDRGLFLFKMQERNNGTPKPLESVRPEIEIILMEKSREEEFKAWQKRLREDAYIDIRI
jgi:peptidyl-prolyl cis-trans isomerase SurA